MFENSIFYLIQDDYIYMIWYADTFKYQYADTIYYLSYPTTLSMISTTSATAHQALGRQNGHLGMSKHHHFFVRL